MKVLTLIKANSNVFLWYVQFCSCMQRSKTKILTTRTLPSWIEFDVVTYHNVKLKVNATWIDYLRLSKHPPGFYKRPINTGTWKLTTTNHIQDVMFDGVASQLQTWSKMAAPYKLDVNILVFDLRLQLQHCTYQRKHYFLL